MSAPPVVECKYGVRVTKGFIFDCDGVLLDSMPLWRIVEQKIAELVGVTFDDDDLRKVYGVSSEVLADHFYQKYGGHIDPDEIIHLNREYALSFYTHEVKARKGSKALVESLFTRGYPLAIASASPLSYIEAGLKRNALFEYFALISSADDQGGSKADPEFYLSLCSGLKVDPHNSWGIDDSALAIRAMNKAGLRTLGLYDPWNQSCTLEDLESEAYITIIDYEELSLATLLD